MYIICFLLSQALYHFVTFLCCNPLRDPRKESVIYMCDMLDKWLILQLCYFTNQKKIFLKYLF